MAFTIHLPHAEDFRRPRSWVFGGLAAAVVAAAAVVVVQQVSDDGAATFVEPGTPSAFNDSPASDPLPYTGPADSVRVLERGATLAVPAEAAVSTDLTAETLIAEAIAAAENEALAGAPSLDQLIAEAIAAAENWTSSSGPAINGSPATLYVAPDPTVIPPRVR